MQGFAWLNDLMLWLGKLFPRLKLVKSTESGVLFQSGGRVRPVPPGLCWYWPLISELKTAPTTTRTQEICAQLVGAEVISIAIFWRIAQPMVALTTMTDITGNLDDHAQASLSLACSSVEKMSNAALSAAVRGILSARVEKLGLEVTDIGIVHRGEPIPVKLINDWATHEEPNRA